MTGTRRPGKSRGPRNAALARHLPEVDYDDLLLDRNTTTLLMTLSIALIAVAVGFVARRPA